MIEMNLDRSKTHIISFSGGMASAVTAILAYEEGFKFELVFADTKIEDEDLYRFIKDVAKAVNKEIYYLSDGRDPWQVFIDDRKMGNSRNANCSTILKKDIVKKWMQNNCSPSMPLVLGMSIFEQERIERARLRWAPRRVVSLLIAYRTKVSQYETILNRHGIQKPRLYEMGFDHNNCGGMCVRAGQRQFATLLAKMPERYLMHEAKELDAHSKIPGRMYPFIRRREDGHTIYLTMREFRERIESGEFIIEPFEDENTACQCFVDD